MRIPAFFLYSFLAILSYRAILIVEVENMLYIQFAGNNFLQTHVPTKQAAEKRVDFFRRLSEKFYSEPQIVHAEWCGEKIC